MEYCYCLSFLIVIHQLFMQGVIIGIINLVRAQNFPKNLNFLPPDTQTYVYVSGGKKY